MAWLPKQKRIVSMRKDNCVPSGTAPFIVLLTRAHRFQVKRGILCREQIAIWDTSMYSSQSVTLQLIMRLGELSALEAMEKTGFWRQSSMCSVTLLSNKHCRDSRVTLLCWRRDEQTLMRCQISTKRTTLTRKCLNMIMRNRVVSTTDPTTGIFGFVNLNCIGDHTNPCVDVKPTGTGGKMAVHS